ncbi:MAG: undecaprenyldiphospho-muramoylpentapeptide beta-N-acetylglucosaminyltransferase [Hyphomicrobium sp.]
MKTSKLVMLAAGGTGGHLFPAFALAEELSRRGFIVDLVTDMRGDKYGENFPARTTYKIPSATFKSLSPIALIKTTYTLLRGFLVSIRLIRKSRPAALIGFGGYPSFMPLLAARIFCVPTAIHEQNAVLGRANRILASYVDFIATSFEKTKLVDPALVSKVHFTGNPTRDVVKKASHISYATYKQGQVFNLLVFGGSQGAKYFSDIVPEALKLLPENLKNNLKIIQQARPEDMGRLRDIYKKIKIVAEVDSFFNDLPEKIASSHLVIARSGASTVAELCVIGRPSILVPLPHSLDNDQLNNALRLAESGGAWCMEQKSLSSEKLSSEIEKLMQNGEILFKAAHRAKDNGKPDAVILLSNMVEEMLHTR